MKKISCNKSFKYIKFRGTLFKRGHYLRKYGILYLFCLHSHTQISVENFYLSERGNKETFVKKFGYSKFVKTWVELIRNSRSKDSRIPRKIPPPNKLLLFSSTTSYSFSDFATPSPPSGVRNIWVFSPLVRSKREKICSFAQFVYFLGNCVYFSIFE